MTDLVDSSDFEARGREKFENQTDKQSKTCNNSQSTLYRHISLVFAAATFAMAEFYFVQSLASSVGLICLFLGTEWLFYRSLRQAKSRPSDYGFVHDLFWAAIAPLAAIYAREGFALSPEEISGSTVYVLASFCIAVFVFPLFSMRHELWEFTTSSALLRICGAVLLNVVLVTFVAFIINRHEGVARTVPLLHFLFLLSPLIGLRVCYRFLRDRDSSKSALRAASFSATTHASAPDHILLVGANRISEFYIKMIEDLGDGSVEVVGLLSDEHNKQGGQIRSVPVLGTTAELRNILHEFDVRGVHTDRIILCCRWSDLSTGGQRALMECRVARNLRIDQMEDPAISLNNVFGFRRLDEPAQNSLLDYAGGRRSDERSTRKPLTSAGFGNPEIEPQVRLSGYFGVKRFVDIASASVLLIVTLPIMLIVGLAVSVAIGFPGLFWQKRPGKNGVVFRVYKFRSMLAPFDRDGNRVPEAERMTAFCRLLRRSRLDELPQLFNILRGDMSLVGPRPLLPVDQPRNAPLRLLIRPGVTGWAQVNGGVDLTPQEKLALDLWYARHATVWLDVKIIFKSVVMIFRGDRKNDEAIGQAMLELALDGSAAA